MNIKSKAPKLVYWIIGYLILTIVYGLAIWNLFPEKSGTFGDMFGGWNSVFAGLGFLGMVYAILQQKEQIAMQSEELRLQRKELVETRKELKRSAEAQEESSQALENQIRVAALTTRLEYLEKHTVRLGEQIALRYQGLSKNVDYTLTSTKELESHIKNFKHNDNLTESYINHIKKLIEYRRRIDSITIELDRILGIDIES